MKSLIAILILLGAVSAHAIKAPFNPSDTQLVKENIIKVTSAKMIVGNSAGNAAEVSMSGDAAMDNTGALTIAAGAIDESALALPAVDGLNSKRIARATYDVAVNLGTIAAHGLGVTLPANSIMTKSWFTTVTQFVDGGAGTVALHCETANNIFTAADITGNADEIEVAGIQLDAIATHDGTGAAGVKGAACELTATVAGAAQTAGKLVLFVEYVVAE